MIQPVIITWSNWQWSKEYTPFGPTEYYLDRVQGPMVRVI